MRKKPTPPSALSLFGDDELSIPDSKNSTTRTDRLFKQKKVITNPASKSTAESRQQPKLTGLALRGRPPKRDKPTASQRASGSRNRRVAAGVKRIELMLTPEAAAALDRLVHHHDLPRAELLGRIILKADARLSKRSLPPKASGKKSPA